MLRRVVLVVALAAVAGVAAGVAAHVLTARSAAQPAPLAAPGAARAGDMVRREASRAAVHASQRARRQRLARLDPRPCDPDRLPRLTLPLALPARRARARRRPALAARRREARGARRQRRPRRRRRGERAERGAALADGPGLALAHRARGRSSPPCGARTGSWCARGRTTSSTALRCTWSTRAATSARATSRRCCRTSSRSTSAGSRLEPRPRLDRRTLDAADDEHVPHARLLVPRHEARDPVGAGPRRGEREPRGLALPRGRAPGPASSRRGTRTPPSSRRARSRTSGASSPRSCR